LPSIYPYTALVFCDSRALVGRKKTTRARTMTGPETTGAPTLPGDWEPTSRGCLRSDDYWIWLYNAAARDARTVLGGPSQTTDCFASSWNPTITYTGSGCPPHYTSACQNTEFGAVTCCPDTYKFGCQSANYPPGIHGEWFRCVSAYASQDVTTITVTRFSNANLEVQNKTRHRYEHLFALALMYTTPVSVSFYSDIYICNKEAGIKKI
jgi:hypothetical protein